MLGSRDQRPVFPKPAPLGVEPDPGAPGAGSSGYESSCAARSPEDGSGELDSASRRVSSMFGRPALQTFALPGPRPATDARHERLAAFFEADEGGGLFANRTLNRLAFEVRQSLRALRAEELEDPAAYLPAVFRFPDLRQLAERVISGDERAAHRLRVTLRHLAHFVRPAFTPSPELLERALERLRAGTSATIVSSDGSALDAERRRRQVAFPTVEAELRQLWSTLLTAVAFLDDGGYEDLATILGALRELHVWMPDLSSSPLRRPNRELRDGNGFTQVLRQYSRMTQEKRATEPSEWLVPGASKSGSGGGLRPPIEWLPPGIEDCIVFRPPDSYLVESVHRIGADVLVEGAPIGDRVELRGHGFGEEVGRVLFTTQVGRVVGTTLWLDAIESTLELGRIVRWSDQEIVVTVPPNTVCGPIEMFVPSGLAPICGGSLTRGKRRTAPKDLRLEEGRPHLWALTFNGVAVEGQRLVMDPTAERVLVRAWQDCGWVEVLGARVPGSELEIGSERRDDATRRLEDGVLAYRVVTYDEAEIDIGWLLAELRAGRMNRRRGGVRQAPPELGGPYEEFVDVEPVDLFQTRELFARVTVSNERGSVGFLFPFWIHRPSEIFVGAVEITQGPQHVAAHEYIGNGALVFGSGRSTWLRSDNSVPLIQGRPTVVRVYLGSDDGTMGGVFDTTAGVEGSTFEIEGVVLPPWSRRVRVTLRARDALGMEMNRAELIPGAVDYTGPVPFAARDGSYGTPLAYLRANSLRSANFRLPVSWSRGGATNSHREPIPAGRDLIFLSVEIESADGLNTVPNPATWFSAHFRIFVPPPVVGVIRLSVAGETAPTVDEIESQLTVAECYLPVPYVDWFILPGVAVNRFSDSFGVRRAIARHNDIVEGEDDLQFIAVVRNETNALTEDAGGTAFHVQNGAWAVNNGRVIAHELVHLVSPYLIDHLFGRNWQSDYPWPDYDVPGARTQAAIGNFFTFVVPDYPVIAEEIEAGLDGAVARDTRTRLLYPPVSPPTYGDFMSTAGVERDGVSDVTWEAMVDWFRRLRTEEGSLRRVAAAADLPRDAAVEAAEDLGLTVGARGAAASPGATDLPVRGGRGLCVSIDLDLDSPKESRLLFAYELAQMKGYQETHPKGDCFVETVFQNGRVRRAGLQRIAYHGDGAQQRAAIYAVLPWNHDGIAVRVHRGGSELARFDRPREVQFDLVAYWASDDSIRWTLSEAVPSLAIESSVWQRAQTSGPWLRRAGFAVFADYTVPDGLRVQGCQWRVLCRGGWGSREIVLDAPAAWEGSGLGGRTGCAICLPGSRS